MELLILVAIVLVAIIIVTIPSKIKYKKKLKARLIAMIGKPPEEMSTEFDSIKRYAQYFPANDLRIDSITWNDLDMDRVFQRINICLSSVGEEYLYNALHQPQFELDNLLKREELVQFFDRHPEERLQVQLALVKLGKQHYNGLPHLIFGADIKLLPRPGLYKFLSVLPLIAAAVFIFSIPAGVVSVLLSFVINLIVHYRTIRRVNIELPAIGYFTLVMKCCKRLLNIKSLPINQDIKGPYDVFKKVTSKAPVQKSTHWSGDMVKDMAEGMWLYFSILFLYDIRHYNNFMKAIISNNNEFHAIYKAIGEVDMALSVLSFRKSLPAFTLPEFHEYNALDFKDIFYPLIPKPITNTCRIDNGSLITGSNASGKSTFIKTLAINGILAQTIYTCTAAKFATRFSMIVTSMALQDNLQNNESYFVVEIKSLKRILDMVKRHSCICYIDEILRGTNTVERIAASASVLEYLHKQDCLCIAASHDIELTRILADKYDNYNFCEQVTDDGITFDYKLKQGPSTTRNAIKLLDVMGFEKEILKQAEMLAVEYSK